MIFHLDSNKQHFFSRKRGNPRRLPLPVAIRPTRIRRASRTGMVTRLPSHQRSAMKSRVPSRPRQGKGLRPRRVPWTMPEWRLRATQQRKTTAEGRLRATRRRRRSRSTLEGRLRATRRRRSSRSTPEGRLGAKVMAEKPIRVRAACRRRMLTSMKMTPIR